MAEGLRQRRRALTRQRILEVAHDHAVAHGWRAARVQEIAAEVGISRPTLYKEFASKEDLGAALVEWEVTKFMAQLEVALREAPPGVGDTVAAGVLAALEEADDPFLAALLTERGAVEGGLLPALSEGSGHVVPLVEGHVVPLLQERFAHLDPDRVRFAAAVAVRLSLSYLLEPWQEARAVTARRVADLCAAYLEP